MIEGVASLIPITFLKALDCLQSVTTHKTAAISWWKANFLMGINKRCVRMQACEMQFILVFGVVIDKIWARLCARELWKAINFWIIWSWVQLLNHKSWHPLSLFGAPLFPRFILFSLLSRLFIFCLHLIYVSD